MHARWSGLVLCLLVALPVAAQSRAASQQPDRADPAASSPDDRPQLFYELWDVGTVQAASALPDNTGQSGSADPVQTPRIGGLIGVQPATGAMTNGANHTGVIAVAGQIDTWTFPATSGNTIALSIGKVSGTF